MRLSELPTTALTLVFVAVVFVAGFLVLNGLHDDVACQTGYTFDDTAGDCFLTSNSSVRDGLTFAGNSSTNIQNGMDNVTSYAPTWGTIIGVAVLLAIVVGGFIFANRRGYL